MRKEKKIIIRNYIFLGILIFIIVNLTYSVIRNFLFYSEWSNKYDLLNIKISKEEVKEEKILRQKKLIYDNKGVEKELLKKYILKKPGEKVIRIID